MRKLFRYSAVFLAAAIVAAASCKKEGEDDLAYMSGSVEYNFPSIAVTGQIIESTVGGIVSPRDVTYFWTSPDLNLGESDTVYSKSVVIEVPDSVGEYTISVVATRSGYYASVLTKTMMAIDPDGNSVSGLAQGTGTFVDERDGEEYRTRKYGSLEWFTDNLRYAGDSDAPCGVAYEKSDGIAYLFGRLYSWNEATGGVSAEGAGNGPQGICPEGWSVPTAEDWEELSGEIGAAGPMDFYDDWSGLGSAASAELTLNGEKMWPYSPENGHDNSSGWNAVPSGNSNNFHSTFENMGTYGMWWSSTETPVSGESKASYRYIYYNSGNFSNHYVDKDSYGVSVRCVRKVQ